MAERTITGVPSAEARANEEANTRTVFLRENMLAGACGVNWECSNRGFEGNRLLLLGAEKPVIYGISGLLFISTCR